MLKKITVEDRREILLATLRKMEGNPKLGDVPYAPEHLTHHTFRPCALGVICQLWPDHINWSGTKERYVSAGTLVGAGTGEGCEKIYQINDSCTTYPEVADKLEKLFAQAPTPA